MPCDAPILSIWLMLVRSCQAGNAVLTVNPSLLVIVADLSVSRLPKTDLLTFWSPVLIHLVKVPKGWPFEVGPFGEARCANPPFTASGDDQILPTGLRAA